MGKYTESGKSNKLVENAIRPFAVDRKNSKPKLNRPKSQRPSPKGPGRKLF